MFTLLAGLISQNLIIPVIAITTIEDQKNYYTPDPNAGTPPTGLSSSLYISLNLKYLFIIHAKYDIIIDRLLNFP